MWTPERPACSSLDAEDLRQQGESIHSGQEPFSSQTRKLLLGIGGMLKKQLFKHTVSMETGALQTSVKLFWNKNVFSFETL